MRHIEEGEWGMTPEGGESVKAERLMTPREAAEFMGTSIQMLQVWVRLGRVPALPWGAQKRYRRSDLERVKDGGLGDLSES